LKRYGQSGQDGQGQLLATFVVASAVPVSITYAVLSSHTRRVFISAFLLSACVVHLAPGYRVKTQIDLARGCKVYM
jgi:hypothetical protein